jgi:hypothetical protein
MLVAYERRAWLDQWSAGGRKDTRMNPAPHGSCLSRGTLALLVALAGTLAGHGPAQAADGSLSIELNKLEDTKQGCRSIFVFDNQTGHELDRFRIDLILFDPAGIYTKQLLLDLAPLYQDKKTVASFLLDDAPCAKIGSILVNDVPWCEDAASNKIDCVKLLQVHSRSAIPLQK